MKSYLTILLLLLLSATVSFSQTWTKQTSGTTDQLRHVFFANATTGWAVGANGTILKTTNGGTAWTSQTLPGKDLLIGCYFVSTTTGWVGGDQGVYKTTDGGSTWTKQTGPTGITKLHFVTASLGWAVGGVDGSTPTYGDIYKTTDGGTTWTKQTNQSTWSRFYGVQFIDANTGWAYTESNGLLIKTTDGGSTWTPQLQYGTTVALRGMYFIDKDNGFVVGRKSTAGAVLKTTNGGTQFTDIANGLQFSITQCYFAGKNLGWAVGNGGPAGRGVLYTIDGGNSWTLSSTGTDVLNNIFMVDDKNGWAVGEAGVIYKYNPLTDVKSENKVSPESFSLQQNYPNPFNPTTTIKYGLSKESKVQITIYNNIGQIVRVLDNSVQNAGYHDIIFSAENMSSGIYFYQMEATATDGSKQFSESKKMVLLK